MKQLIRKFAFWLLDITNYKPKQDALQIAKEQKCVEEGHIWRSELSKTPNAINLKTKNRIFCVRCGQKYHEHIYKQ